MVHRSDGSGTTFVLSKHLAAISPEWAAGPGTGTAVAFPVGVGGRKNDGVTALIQQTPGAIGYIEYAYALASGLPMAALENASRHFVSPRAEAFSAALASVELPADLRGWLADPPAQDAYPIVSYTWILARQTHPDPARGAALRTLLEWCLDKGQHVAPKLHYVPLPARVADRVRAKVATLC